MSQLIEYKVRPVTRYVVTRFERDGSGSNSTQRGEFDSAQVAHEIAYALCKAEHEQLGWPIGDERIQYPDSPPQEADGQRLGQSAHA